MNERILPGPELQVFYISRETSNCPLISEMIKLGKSLQEIGLTDADIGIMSLDYGKRLLINAKNIDIKNMNQQDVVEIVDYDPLKNIMMVIGTKDPCLETPVHWIIQKARYDINALLQINSMALSKRLSGACPSIEKEIKPNTLDTAKEILKMLRTEKTFLIKNQTVLFAGISLKEIQDMIYNYLGGQK